MGSRSDARHFLRPVQRALPQPVKYRCSPHDLQFFPIPPRPSLLLHRLIWIEPQPNRVGTSRPSTPLRPGSRLSCQAERVILALPCHHCLSGRCGGSLSTLAPRVNGRPQCVSPASSFRQRSYWRPSPPSPPSSDQFAASSTIPSIVRRKMPWSCCARKRQHGPPAPIPMRPASSFSTASPLANTRSQWLLPVSIKLCRTFELVRDHNPFC